LTDGAALAAAGAGAAIASAVSAERHSFFPACAKKVTGAPYPRRRLTTQALLSKSIRLAGVSHRPERG
jgi:hypothetical protein